MHILIKSFVFCVLLTTFLLSLLSCQNTSMSRIEIEGAAHAATPLDHLDAYLDSLTEGNRKLFWQTVNKEGLMAAFRGKVTSLPMSEAVDILEVYVSFLWESELDSFWQTAQESGFRCAARSAKFPIAAHIVIITCGGQYRDTPKGYLTMEQWTKFRTEAHAITISLRKLEI